MGTWDNGHFDNDGALDFLDRLTTKDTLTPVEGAFDAILFMDGYMDVDYGEEAVAAAEVVALLKGKPAEGLPDSLIKWHKTHPLKVDEGLTAKAIQAVEKVMDPEISEFRQLREEDEGLPGWYENITDLLNRLRS